MYKLLRLLFILICFFSIISLVALYSYGSFAKRVKGENSYALPIADNQSSLDRMLQSESQEHPGKSGLMLITNNLDAFTIRALSAREAVRSLDLQYYIWHDDLTGKLLDNEVLQAANRGVRVRILLDDMNAHGKNSILAALNQHPNIQIRMFNPTRARRNGIIRGLEILLRAFSINHRMHNKAWIVDGRLAVVGGRNIGDEYFSAAQKSNFFDADLVVQGDVVTEASYIFDRFWNSDYAIPLEALVKIKQNALALTQKRFMEAQRIKQALPYIQQITKFSTIANYLRNNIQWPIYWTEFVHIYSDPPEKASDQNKSTWLIHQLLPIIEKADKNVKIISPYFVPGDVGMKEFLQLRQQNVDVEILTNSLAANDVLLVHSGYSHYRKPLLKSGVQLYELKSIGKVEKSIFGSSNASLHTKAFLVDNTIGFVGSMNFDPRSTMLNTEMGVLFQEPSITAALNKEFSKRSSSSFSYQLSLKNGKLLWQDEGNEQQPRFFDNEPQSSWWQRMLATVIGWLPIESQL